MPRGWPQGKPNLKLRRPLFERFNEKWIPEPNSGCWLWTASTNPISGYGVIGVSSEKTKPAHRVSWELYRGPIPAGVGHHGTCVLHKCDNRACVNPDHLFLGSNKDNVHDCMRKGRFKNVIAQALKNQTSCKHGHEMTVENTYWYRGGRTCRKCRLASLRGFYDRRKQKNIGLSCQKKRGTV